jgi:peptidyl-tRNA hydrolase
MDPADYVLQEFDEVDRSLLEETLERALAAVRLFATDGIEAAMTRYNGRGS